MPDDFSVTPLFGSTSLSTPKAGPLRPALQQPPHGDAFASAFLASLVSDVTTLKGFMRDQIGCNEAASNTFRAHQGGLEAQATVNKAFMDLLNQQTAALAELDKRLCALDGKPPSLKVVTDETGAADTASTPPVAG